MIGQNVKFIILRRLQKFENLSQSLFDITLLVGIVFQIVVAFSEYMNFECMQYICFKLYIP